MPAWGGGKTNPDSINPGTEPRAEEAPAEAPAETIAEAPAPEAPTTDEPAG